MRSGFTLVRCETIQDVENTFGKPVATSVLQVISDEHSLGRVVSIQGALAAVFKTKQEVARDRTQRILDAEMRCETDSSVWE
jgi:hypothetical protein